MSFARSLAVQSLLVLGLAVAAGGMRQLAPDGLSWVGRWPAAATSAEQAYAMMARPDDPPYVSLAEAVSLQRDPSVVFLDARTTHEFSEGRIPGARNLPYYDLESFHENALRGLQEDTKIIIYCEGVGCELSLFLGRELRDAGLTNIGIFYGGYPEWTAAGLPIDK